MLHTSKVFPQSLILTGRRLITQPALRQVLGKEASGIAAIVTATQPVSFPLQPELYALVWLGYRAVFKQMFSKRKWPG